MQGGIAKSNKFDLSISNDSHLYVKSNPRRADTWFEGGISLQTSNKFWLSRKRILTNFGYVEIFSAHQKS